MPERLYHYTYRDFAEECLRDIDEPGVAAEISDGTYGPGFYALDLGPEDATREELRFQCFGDARPDHPMDGVLVLEAELSVPPFESQYEHIWLLPAEPGSSISIGHMLIEVAIWEESAESWRRDET
jgi:hypothetical protein